MKDRKSIDNIYSLAVCNAVTRQITRIEQGESKLVLFLYSKIRHAGADGDNLGRNKSS